MKKYVFSTSEEVVADSRDSSSSATTSSAVPMMGNTLYRPRREISWPLPTEVSSMPITMGSR